MTKNQSEAATYENPLMPSKKLHQLQAAVVEIKALEKHLLARAPKSERFVAAQAAARASTVLSLETGDLISDCSETSAMDLLLGAKTAELKRRTPAKAATRKLLQISSSAPMRLPFAHDVREQMEISLGAAAALKAQRNGRVLLLFAAPGDAHKKLWKQTLRVAGRRDLPILFVVLPPSDDSPHTAGELAPRSQDWGVPGIPVEATDVVALYRVTQESLLRARTDGGPALIECIPFDLKGAGKGERHRA